MDCVALKLASSGSLEDVGEGCDSQWSVMEWWRDQKRCVINMKNVAVVVLTASNILSEFVTTKTLTSDRSSAPFLKREKGR
jgi:hypothetical protein